MFCPSCGNETIQELRYCNRCGASLNTPTAPERPKGSGAIITLLIMVTAITLGGLGIIFPALIELKRSGFSEGMMGMFMFFSFLILGLIDVTLVRQLSRLLNAPAQPGQFLPPKRTATNDLSSPRQISALGEPVPSVTENTTRKFEPAYREPRA
jgi:hypothetical protein